MNLAWSIIALRRISYATSMRLLDFVRYIFLFITAVHNAAEQYYRK